MLLVTKLPRRQVVDGKTRTLSDTERWVIDGKKDFHTHFGVLPKAKLKPGSFELAGETFVIVPAQPSDIRLTRKAQIITRKDVGFVAGYCGLSKESVVVESGAGSGGATVTLARMCKKIHSYEIEKEYIGIVKENLERFKLKNAQITHADFYDEKGVKKHDADLVLLDLPEPWRAFASARKAATLGGFVVAYTPSIVQAARFVNELPGYLLHERTLELIDRDWKIQGDAVRPVNAAIGHTAFLTICRRLL
jgi:tRNA A58 N-methylase Trm61